jgi:anti-sigma regulatory factor (Ser/Thr protein kinase)
MSDVSIDELAAEPTQCQDFHEIAELIASAKNQEIRISFPSNRRLIAPVLVMLREIAQSMGSLTEREQLTACIALEEALVNAVVHGNLEVSSKLRDLEDDSFEQMIATRLEKAPYGDRQVEVIARLTPLEASFTIRDEGPGFNVADVPDPTAEENICLTHGRGLFLMRSFMDEVTHNSTGNQVTLVKRKSPSE